MALYPIRWRVINVASPAALSRLQLCKSHGAADATPGDRSIPRLGVPASVASARVRRFLATSFPSQPRARTATAARAPRLDCLSRGGKWEVGNRTPGPGERSIGGQESTCNESANGPARSRGGEASMGWWRGDQSVGGRGRMWP
ncbi:hypothetical protein TCAP_06150 [Tolypocladium capitatum]|uniref:Uncharacterized protein n=1 Tax=Tolypocladium capitatum TaxID=45235 RepID=A0A2K3Q8T4_9HYPO|nr:hypothetical protein TCAP_06150 [Tolypocladium capitatum]